MQSLIYSTPDDLPNATDAALQALRAASERQATGETRLTMQCPPLWMMSWPEERWALRNGGLRAVWRSQATSSFLPSSFACPRDAASDDI